ncbi:MAG: pyridoxal-phosphate dependent enzyme [Alphaproteobacteria bacterium]|nr:pyridoxal-phosphate dependent enzyme [Alphaproteobacteria bacterium]
MVTSNASRAAAAPTDRSTLQTALDRVPRLRFGHLPTALEFCPRLTAALGGPDIFVKRDDCTGIAFGGNKVRQHEFLFAAAKAAGADTVVLGAATQSNWCRQASAIAARLGMAASLVLVHGVKGPVLQGNLLLDRVLGAEVTIVPGTDLEVLPQHLAAKAAELKAKGRKPFVFGWADLRTQSTAALGYVNAALELDAQLTALGKQADAIYLAGFDVTPAGLLWGIRALGMPTQMVTLNPLQVSGDRHLQIAAIAGGIDERLGIRVGIEPDQVITIDDYIGPAYGIMTDAGREAILLAGRTEGLILDPVYTSKAMAGLIDHIRKGTLKKGQTVVFIHTGGTPALFAYADDMKLDLADGGIAKA